MDNTIYQSYVELTCLLDASITKIYQLIETGKITTQRDACERSYRIPVSSVIDYQSQSNLKIESS